jgi:cytochrome c2
VLAALSTGHKIGLLAVAAIFIVFALASAVLIPRWKPGFPARGLPAFILGTVVLFAGMMTAVLILGREPKEAAAENGTTTTQATVTGTTATTAVGNAANGKALSTSLGCSSCHSIDGSSGVGPTWKGLYGSQVQLANGQTVTADDAYLIQSIEDPDKDIVQGFQPGIMSGVIKPGQVSRSDAQDLVAFIKTLS